MKNKIKEFKRDAAIAKRDHNSISELKVWLKADNTIPSAVKEVDRAYVELKEVKNKLTKIFHELSGEDAVDGSTVLEQLNKAMENMETLLSRYA
jgi:hypothetical protein